MNRNAGRLTIILIISSVFTSIIACNMLYTETPISNAIPTSTRNIPSTSAVTPTSLSFKPGDPTATPLGSEITDPNYIKGVEAIYAGSYEEALTLLNAAVETNPDLAPPYQYRGLAYWLLGDCVSALADEEKALSIDPKYAAALARRGGIQFCLGNDEQALMDSQKALTLDPSLAFVHHNLGYYYYQQGDYEKSLDEYGLSVAIDPNRSGAWLGITEALTQLGRFDECIINATKTLEVKSDEWFAYDHRAYCEQFTGDIASVIADYTLFLEHHPESRDAWNNLGLAQTDAGLNSEAVVSLNQALELDPSYYQSNINRGWAYIALGKHNEALDDFNRALEFGDIPAAYSGRGTAYYYLGRYHEAMADLELAAQMMPDRPHSYCFLALTYFEVGRYQDSLDAASVLNQIEPGCGGQQLLEIQARSHYALGEYEQAISYISQALAMGPYPLGFYYQGVIYDDAGKDAEAALWLEQFLLSVQDDSKFAKEIADAKARLTKLKP